MKELAVLGTGEFTLGFRLTGIRHIVTAQQPSLDLQRLLQNQDLGIVIIDQETMQAVDEDTQEKALASLQPVVVVVSETSAQDDLRNLIIQSIGVDLLKEQEGESL